MNLHKNAQKRTLTLYFRGEKCFFVLFFEKIFAYIRKKLYFCTAFFTKAPHLDEKPSRSRLFRNRKRRKREPL